MLEVWAPGARLVELDLGEAGRLPLDRGEDGVHRGGPRLGSGQRYSLRLDGGDPLPDPRSPWQPDGVHGPSAHVDHAAFAWTDEAFRPGDLKDQVCYELHTGTFSPEGTFDGAISKLDHLVDLGITAVELMPVAEFSGGRGWGYDGVDLFAPHHAYGGPEGLKRLVEACHGRGLAVVMDVVYNHVGAEGNYLPRFGPYFSDTHATAWGKALNYDGPGAGEVRRFVIDNALTWLRDYHCDGLRLDAVHAYFDDSAEHVLDELAAAVRALERETGRRYWVIEESGQRAPRGLLDGHWCDDFHHALHACLTGERSGYYRDFGSVSELAEAITHGYVRRRFGAPPSTLVVCAQNHDQVGNRARGERLSQLLSPGLLRCAAALVLASPQVPLLFQGEEWGASTPFLFFSDHRNPEIAAATTRGRIQEFAHFGWAPEQVPDPQDPATFQRSKLLWEERRAAPHAGLLDWYRTLIRLRRSNPELRSAEVRVTHSEADRLLVVERGPLVFAFNLAGRPQRVETPAGGVDVGPESVELLAKT